MHPVNGLNAQTMPIFFPIKKTSKILFYKLRHSRAPVIIFKTNNLKKILAELKPLKCIQKNFFYNCETCNICDRSNNPQPSSQKEEKKVEKNLRGFPSPFRKLIISANRMEKKKYPQQICKQVLSDERCYDNGQIFKKSGLKHPVKQPFIYNFTLKKKIFKPL